MKITSGGDDNKPALFIDAGIHAREWIAPTTALYIIQQLVENSTNRYIFENLDIYVIPSLNPDGYTYSQLSNEVNIFEFTDFVKTNFQACATEFNVTPETSKIFSFCTFDKIRIFDVKKRNNFTLN